jgi:hypothetical protein
MISIPIAAISGKVQIRRIADRTMSMILIARHVFVSMKVDSAVNIGFSGELG